MRKLVTSLLVAALCCLRRRAGRRTPPRRSSTIRGAGFGHGIGMSQYGAYGYALHGATYRYILGHYYTGTDARARSTPTARSACCCSRRAGSRSPSPARPQRRRRRRSTRRRPTTVRRSGAGASTCVDATGKSVGTFAGPLRVDAPPAGRCA